MGFLLQNLVSPIINWYPIVWIASIALAVSFGMQKKLLWALLTFLFLPTIYYWIPSGLWWLKLVIIFSAAGTTIGSWFMGNGRKAWATQVLPRIKQLLGIATEKAKSAAEKAKEGLGGEIEEGYEQEPYVPTSTARAQLTLEKLWE